MKILPCELFNTPKSLDHVGRWIEIHPQQDRPHLYTAMYMTLNYLVSIKGDDLENIKSFGIFTTPESVDVITDWIERHNPQDKIHLYTAMYMTWNYLASIDKENLTESENEVI